ncbi:MAG TPA: hypothetical protein V6C81_31590 [Planktothrix sp.]|jgi:hypothetical protein
MKLALAIMSLVALALAPVAMAMPDQLPNTGVYFITNSGNYEALQPVAPSLGQNVGTKEFNKGGGQKWFITRQFDVKTGQPSNRYTIRLAGDNDNLKLQPHPAIDTATIVSSDGAVFVVEPTEGGMLLHKSNGDVLYVAPNPPMMTEAKWGPDDGSPKYRWNFVPAM